MPLALKWTNVDGTPCNGGKGQWLLPAHGRPGDWMTAIRGELVPCQRGYHLCRLPPAYDALGRCGPALWIAEYDGEMIEAGEKIVVRRARLIRRVETWTETTARLLACDFAERALPIFARARPDDDRPRKAIETARRFARGQATREELAAAAWAAARDAAGDVARDVAEDAAAWDAAWDAERAWQMARFSAALGLPAIIAEVERELSR